MSNRRLERPTLRPMPTSRQLVDLEGALSEADAVEIVTAHPSVDYEAVVAQAALTIDLCGVTRIEAANLVRL
jgi:UDP-N-acetyl-D-mannosaminuronate dehydrogenase